MRDIEASTFNLLKAGSLLEMAIGVALMLCPSCVTLMLFGNELIGADLALGRLAGFGLFSLGIACWPVVEIAARKNPAVWGLLSYGTLITLYLIQLGLEGHWVGWLLWPAVLVHAVITLLLAWKFIR